MISAGNGGSIVLTSSMADLKVYPGMGAYSAAKYAIVGLMKTLVAELAPHSNRVKTVHPTQTDTPMVMNEGMFTLFRPDLTNPTRDDFMEASATLHVLPVAVADPIDITRALVFLASDDSRLITGLGLPVDAALLLK